MARRVFLWQQGLLLRAGLVLAAGAASAAPPPAPPVYVADAAALLARADGFTVAAAGGLFAADVVVHQNGKLVAAGKPTWLAWRAAAQPPRSGRLLGYSEGWTGDGALLVLDLFDAVDRSALPPTFLADPRIVTRSTLYRFGADRLIHAVDIAQVDGFLERPDTNDR